MSPIQAQPVATAAPQGGNAALAPPASQAQAAAPVSANAGAATPAVAPAPRVDPAELQKKLEEAVARLNEQMQANGRKLGFSVDDRLNKQIVRVMNKETGEVVRQIPNEVVIRVANSIEDLKGVLFDAEF